MNSTLSTRTSQKWRNGTHLLLLFQVRGNPLLVLSLRLGSKRFERRGLSSSLLILSRSTTKLHPENSDKQRAIEKRKKERNMEKLGFIYLFGRLIGRWRSSLVAAADGFGSGSAGEGGEVAAVGGNGRIARSVGGGERRERASGGCNRHLSSWAEEEGEDGGCSRIFLIRLSVRKSKN